MIGVDTNVLLRFALRDHPAQSARAARFLQDDERLSSPAVICPVVLVEFVWTLQRKNGFSKERLLDILDAFTDSERIAYSDERLIRSAIEQWRSGEADFADYLIAASNMQAGARSTATFDRIAAGGSGFTLLPA